MSNQATKIARAPSYRERAAQARDSAGRFIKRAPDAANPLGAERSLPKSVRVPLPLTAHPETYALRVDEDGLGLHAEPGANVIVEPVAPEGAGLAVFYLKDRPGAVIFDLTHSFCPDRARAFGTGSEIMPLIDLCEPITGLLRRVRADRVEKIHRIISIYTPAEAIKTWPPAPPKLPLMTACPEGMGEHFADDTACYPTVRPGETVIYDPAQREPIDGALCVLEWNSGRRSVLTTRLRRSGGKGELRWWVDPVNRPIGREAFERRLAVNSPGDMLHTSDGPYTVAHLRERIVGIVVGILVSARSSQRERA